MPPRKSGENILLAHIANGVKIEDRTVQIDEGVVIAPGATILAGTILRGNTVIGPGCVIGPNSLIEDSIMDEGTTVNASQVYGSHLGPHNNIGPFTHVRVNTVTDYGVHLGAYVETKNSNFARGNTVSHLTYIGDSDVGKYCNFGCGTVTCNYDGKDKFRTHDRRLLLHWLQHQPGGPGQGGRRRLHRRRQHHHQRCACAGAGHRPGPPDQSGGLGRPQDGSLHRQKEEAGGRAEQITPVFRLQTAAQPLLYGGFVQAHLFVYNVYLFARVYVILMNYIRLLSQGWKSALL